MPITHRLAALFLVSATISLAQQVLTLTGGTQLQGRFDGGNANTISFVDEHGNRHRFNITEIQSIVFNASPPVERGYADTDAPSGGAWSRTATIPAGTEVVVRTIDPIDTRQPDPRQRFLASVERDVLDSNGNVAIPRGAGAHLIAHEVGGGEIAIDLRSVRVNGRRLVLNSENLTNVRPREGLGANERTGAFVGGTALLGTILGAIGGGGKGAAIGALAGAAAGAGAQVLTRGQALHIPSETILRFRLDRPVYLYQ